MENKMGVFLIILLVVVPIIFGIIGKVKEMGLMIVAIGIALAFINLEKLSEFTGAGISVKVNTAVNKTYAAIDQLKELAVSVSSPIVDELAISGLILQKYIHLKYKLERVAKIKATLEKLGVPETEIEEVCSTMYQRVTHDHMRKVLIGLKSSNPEKESLFEGLNKWDLFDWDTGKLDKLITDNNLNKNEETEEYIRDLDYFLKNKKLRREELWQS